MDLTGALAIVAVFGVILALFLRFLRGERKRAPEERRKLR